MDVVASFTFLTSSDVLDNTDVTEILNVSVKADTAASLWHPLLVEARPVDVCHILGVLMTLNEAHGLHWSIRPEWRHHIGTPLPMLSCFSRPSAVKTGRKEKIVTTVSETFR